MLKLIALTIILFFLIMILCLCLSNPLTSSDIKHLTWFNFKKVIKECEIKTGEDFEHFMSVVGHRPLGSNYDEEILKPWKEHKNSIKKAVKRIKK